MPSVYDAADQDFVVMGSQEQFPSKLSLSEQLYSARGSQSVGAGQSTA
jgi:hypothetical protein